jgi:hypothetical protein
MLQVLSLIGALAVLGAYLAIQTKKLDAESAVYQALNFGGSVALGAVAVVVFNYGFILLNVIWALVSLRALLIGYRRHRQRSVRAPTSDP